MSNSILNNPSEMKQRLTQRNEVLNRIAAELKTELFGIDSVIDRVMNSVRTWYILPQAVSRPVIICLWGLTGTGKTQLVRSLARKLDFYDRFVEIQMDGFSTNSSSHGSSISSILGDSGIIENAPGILFLDEFQRYRTINDKKEDEKVSRYQDVWGLLSDGRLPPDLSFLLEMETSLARTQYDLEREDEEDIEEKQRQKLYKFQLSTWEAKRFKRTLKLQEPLIEIMTWTNSQIENKMREFQETQDSWDTNYSKLLIFISGNLDEMYESMANRVEDCDTDADIFYSLSTKLSLIDVKKALRQRFKPEQIARLGNNHIIYPSLNQATYKKLIQNTCDQYTADLHTNTGFYIEVQDSVQQAIYANGVFPTQGTRPLFSSLQSILTSPMMNIALWALEKDIPQESILRLELNEKNPFNFNQIEANSHQKNDLKIDLKTNSNVYLTDLSSQNQVNQLNQLNQVNQMNNYVDQTNHYQNNYKDNPYRYIEPEFYVEVQTPNGLERFSQTVTLEVSRLKQRTQEDFRALLAVHEAGHGLVFALLLQTLPNEIKINVASFEGGYNSFSPRRAWSKQNMLDRICVGLAGRVAEKWIFGENACTTGAEEDFKNATENAAKFVRHWGFSERLSYSDVSTSTDDNVNTDIQPTNHEIEMILQKQHERALDILQKNRAIFLKMIQTLLKNGQIEPTQLSNWLGWIMPDKAFDLEEDNRPIDAYAGLLNDFMMKKENHHLLSSSSSLFSSLDNPSNLLEKDVLVD